MAAAFIKSVNQKLAVANTPEDLYYSATMGGSPVTKFSLITDRYTFFLFDQDGTPNNSNSTPIKPGEGFAESDVLLHRLRFVNVVPGEQPHVRGVLWS